MKGRAIAILAALAAGAVAPVVACLGDPPIPPDPSSSDAGTDADAASMMDADAAPDAMLECDGGSSVCGDKCLDLMNDAENCGACAHACETGETCTGGHCPGEITGLATLGFGFCVLRYDKNVRCWGSVDWGECGPNETDTMACSPNPCTNVPTLVPLPPTASIAGGRQFACAIGVDGKLRCWGRNQGTQLGRVTIGSCTPDKNSGMCDPSPALASLSLMNETVSQVALGDQYACARISNGKVYCWGAGIYENFGAGGPAQSPPVLVSLPDAAFDIAVAPYASKNLHACAIVGPKRRVYCWGSNGLGELGHDPAQDPFCSTDPKCSLADCGANAPCLSCVAIHCQGTPEPVVDGTMMPIEGVKKIGAGFQFTCALKDDMTTWCWGENSTGVAGPTIDDIPHGAATQVMAAPKAVDLAVSAYSIFERTPSGDVFAWGSNDSGAIGDGTNTGMGCGNMNTTACVPAPTKLPALLKDAVVSTHERVYGALGPKGEVIVWGINSTGALGHPTGMMGDIPTCGVASSTPCNVTPKAATNL